MTLYSYCLRFGSGAAPNPFWGVCTPAICKPGIRRSAIEGDWIVGLGSADSPIGNISHSAMYVMRVTRRPHTMEEYDRLCRESLPGKIPDWDNPDFRRRAGDCIYGYSSRSRRPTLRRSIHSESNRERGLSGMNVL